MPEITPVATPTIEHLITPPTPQMNMTLGMGMIPPPAGNFIEAPVVPPEGLIDWFVFCWLIWKKTNPFASPPTNNQPTQKSSPVKPTLKTGSFRRWKRVPFFFNRAYQMRLWPKFGIWPMRRKRAIWSRPSLFYPCICWPPCSRATSCRVWLVRDWK